MWEIKGKDNVVKTTVNALEYNGEWMSECYISVNVESPTPVNFEIGDYLIYRDERFEINYDPGKIKSAPQYAKGDAFRYENIKFNSLADELTNCEFYDVVIGDNKMHYGLPTYNFYATSVRDVANRIQANLDRTYGKNTWTVNVVAEFEGKTNINVKVDKIKVWGALEICVKDFEAYFTIKDRTITIGAAGIPAGHLFKYGKGNGLYELEQNAEADQKITTRLHAYGSTRNLPHRYYHQFSGADGKQLVPDSLAVDFLMLPGYPTASLRELETDSTKKTYLSADSQDPYIDSKNIDTIRVREDSVYFDGSQEGLEEIYPSIEGMTAEDLHKADVQCNATGALDEIVGAEQMTDNGVGEIKGDKSELAEADAYFKVHIKDPGFDMNDYLIEGNAEAPTMSFKTGKLGGRDFEIFSCKPLKNRSGAVTGYELELKRVYDDGLKLWFPYKDHNAAAGDKFVLLHIKMPEVYIKAASQRLLEAATEWLSKNDYSRSVYAPKIDEIFMARQHDEAMASGGKIKSLHDTLKEGMLLLFEDSDLNIDASIFIDRLTIKEDSPIPTYEVVLKEEKTVGTLQKMQNKIDSLAAGIGQGGGGYNASQIRSMIDAYGGTRFLSKIKSDRTPYALSVGGKLAAEGGVQFGPVFAEGITGFGGKVDENGRAWLESLVLRGFLEVPELRYNRTEVSVGNDWNAPGGGTLEAVEPDRDADGSPLHTGKATLRLEAGELGAVAAGDICMGIWHDSFSPESNSAEDSDDSKGNFRFSGFRTVCFRITEILDAGDNSRFRYALRDESPSYPSAFHPSAQMTFVSYGSFTRPDRRTSRYSTRTYTRYLRGVDTWEFGADNVAAQFGDLTNLSVFGFDMEGYSVYLDNVYMKGTVQSVGLARHWIEASAQQVVRHPDGTASPATLTAKGWRKDSTGRVEEHGSVSYLTASGASGTVPPAGLATRGLDFPVELRLTGGGDAGVSLTVAEVRDGADGTPGTYTENLLEGSADFSPLHTGWPPRTDGEWFTFYPDYVSASQTERIDGRPAVRVRKTDSDTPMFVGVRQFIDMSGFEDGETFTLGFRTLVKDASVFDDTAYAELNFYDEGLNRIRSFGYAIPADTNLGVRTHLFSDTKPKGARHAEASLFLIHNGEAWFGSPKLSRGVQEEYAWTPSPADLRGKDGDKGDKGDDGAPGAPGAPGADGAVIRTTEWEAGKKYWDGREVDPQTGVRPLDIVVVASADGLSRSVWLCTLSHTSSEGLKPGDGSLESMMSWSQFSSLTPISTPLLLADNAKITFLNTQEILIVVEGAVAGRFGGGQTPLWTGGATAATAKFALSNTGKVRFGNDGGQRVELDPSTNGMSIYDGEGRKTEFRGERVADIAGIFKAASLAVSGIVASGGTSSDEQQTKSQRVATVKAATAGNLKVSCTLELNSGHEYAEAEAEVYVTDSVGNTVWADSLSSERDTGPKSKAVNADIYLPAAGTYLVQASLRARKYDYYAPGSDLSQGPTQTYDSYAGWSGLKVGGAGTVYKAQYLSNGWAIGNGSDSYASVWEDAAGKMRFEALCGGKGMKVGPDGVRVNHGNGWGSVPRTLLSGWLNWTGSSYQWAWRSTGEGILSGNPQKQAVGKVFIPLTAGMPDPSRLSVQVTGRFTPLETAVGDITASGPTPGITVLLSSGGKATDSGFLITISEI